MNKNNKIAGFIITFFVLLLFSMPANAQWNWGGELFWGMNDTARVWSFNTNVELFLAEDVSFGIEGDVNTKGFSLTKEGPGHLIIFNHNPLWDGDMLFASDTVPGTIELTGTLGERVNDSIGHLYNGAIRSSDNQYSHFIINQHDTVVQTLSSTSDSAFLHIELTGKSVLRTGDFPNISGFFSATGGGTMYTNGIDSGRVHLLNESRLITGRDAPHGAKDYAVIMNTTDSTVYVDATSFLQIGDYEGPSLAGVAGNVYQDGVLEIEVYDQATSWALTAYPNGDASWTTAYADRVNVFAGGDYNLGTTAKMDVTFDPAYVASIANDTVFYIPVISLADTTLQDINGADNVQLFQNLPGWVIGFVIGDGTNGTNPGWGYIKGRREFFAVTDEVTIQKNTPVYINVMANDIIYDRDQTDIDIITPPVHGTVSLIDKDFYYVPDNGFTGRDSFVYEISNDTLSSQAKVYINVIPPPDNISDADCFIEPESFEWTIREDWRSTQTNVSTYLTPVVGDLDGDKLAEIVVGTYGGSNSSNYRPSNNLLVYRGNDRTTPIIIDVTGEAGNFLQAGTLGMARIPIGSDTVPLIVMIDRIGRLRAYNPFSKGGADLAVNDYVWMSAEAITDPYTNTLQWGAVSFADFNADGAPEIYVGNRIFNAATGVILVDGTTDVGMKGATNIAVTSGTYQFLPAVADIDGDGQLEYVAGTSIFDVNITNKDNATGNAFVLSGTPISPLDIGGGKSISDGWTILADVNKDGRLDAIVVVHDGDTGKSYTISAWDIYAKKWLGFVTDNTYQNNYAGIPFVGDIDADGNLEAVQTAAQSGSAGCLRGYRLNGASAFTKVYETSTSDVSGTTGMTLFDFNLDGTPELVYRDQTDLRIMQAMPDGTFDDLLPLTTDPVPGPVVGSGTYVEYPIVADVDNDGSAEIVVVGGVANNAVNGTVRIYKGDKYPWAPARRVWNQYAYNVVNVNEDLTIPTYPMNSTIVFAGQDGVVGTSDDMHPYNNFLQQQTMLNKDGEPLYITPDATPIDNLSTSTAVGDSVSITVGIINNGDAPMGSPIYVTLYADTTLAAQKITTDSLVGYIQPGDTGYVTVNIPDITPYLSAIYIVARINDNGMQFPYQAECDSTNVIKFINPAIMKKKATLNGVQDNGTYPNPVSVLYGENITYDIDAVNANKNDNSSMTITDTLPPYLNYVTGSATDSPISTTTTGTPQQTVLTWTLNGLAAMATETVSYEATPESGASASQPLYINRAWVRVSDTVFVHTNSTYHQGAGVAIVTFSASNGGWIFNAEEQALDYKTTPRTGITVIPEEGYQFTGWSHNAYTSLRGEPIPADSSLFNYEDITIYGNVDLRANFAPITEIPVKQKENPEPVTDKTEKVWSNENDLYIRAAKGTVARVYSTKGVLLNLITITKDGITTTKLERGVYVVTLNGAEGWKVMIE